MSVDAVQDNDTELDVTPVERRPVGAVGGCVSVGGVVPPHEAPLTVQFVGRLPPEALKPNCALAPGLIVPL